MKTKCVDYGLERKNLDKNLVYKHWKKILWKYLKYISKWQWSILTHQEY